MTFSVKTIVQRIEQNLRSGEVSIPATAHANLVKGNVVAIDVTTGATAAPADNDRLGFFGVAAHSIALGEEGKFIIRGFVDVMTGDTSDAGTFMNPMEDMMVNTVATQTDGNGFCKLLEAGVDGHVKKALIVNQ